MSSWLNFLVVVSNLAILILALGSYLLNAWYILSSNTPSAIPAVTFAGNASRTRRFSSQTFASTRPTKSIVVADSIFWISASVKSLSAADELPAEHSGAAMSGTDAFHGNLRCLQDGLMVICPQPGVKDVSNPKKKRGPISQSPFVLAIFDLVAVGDVDRLGFVVGRG